MKTYYDSLEIHASASTEVINAAYKALSKKYHPDVSNDKDALQKMQEINVARDTLLDEEKRKQYDRGLEYEKRIVEQNKQTAKKQYSGYNSDNFDPRKYINLQYLERYHVGNKVVIRYCFYDECLYITFSSKSTESFNYVRELIKTQGMGKFNPETKYWKCYEPFYEVVKDKLHLK